MEGQPAKWTEPEDIALGEISQIRDVSPSDAGERGPQPKHRMVNTGCYQRWEIGQLRNGTKSELEPRNTFPALHRMLRKYSSACMNKQNKSNPTIIKSKEDKIFVSGMVP